MKKKLFSVLQYILFLGIGISLTWWQLGKLTPSEWDEFKKSLLNANYIVLLPVFVLMILGHISRAMRWKILIEPLGYHPNTANTFYATMCGYFANTFLPRAGEILRCTLLSRYEKIPVTKLFGTILLERVFDLFCYFLVIVITFLIQIETVNGFIREKIKQLTTQRTIPFWVIIVFILLFASLILIIIRWVLKKNKEHRLVMKLHGIYIGLREGFSSILHLKKRKTFIAHTIFIWSTYLFEIYVGFFALSETSTLPLGAAFSVLSLATLAMIVSPGGLGAFPVAVQQVLLIYGLNNISFGWLMWGVTTGIVVVVGMLCFGLLIYQNKNSKEQFQDTA